MNLYRTLILFTALSVVGCVQAQAPTDLGDTPTSTTTSSSTTGSGSTGSGGSSGSTTTSSGPYAYVQDIKAVLDSDCLACHGPRRADAGYSVANYAQVMRAARAGASNSTLIAVTRSGGSMYRYWSGSSATRAAKAEMVRAWIVNYSAQENR